MSIEKADEDLGYLLHQGKVRVCQRLWLANLENHVLEDQDDGKHGDDDNNNDDDEVVDYEDDDEEEGDDSQPPWSLILWSMLEDLAKLQADQPLGAGLCRTFKKSFYFIIYHCHYYHTSYFFGAGPLVQVCVVSLHEHSTYSPSVESSAAAPSWMIMWSIDHNEW